MDHLKWPNLDPLVNSVADYQDRLFPVFASNSYLNFIDENFAKQGFTNEVLIPWAPLKRPRRKTKKKTKQAILIDTGRLRRGFTVVSANPDGFTIGTYVPYAKIHNQGGIVEGIYHVDAHTRKVKGKQVQVSAHRRFVRYVVPARPFIGESQYFSNLLLAEHQRVMAQLLNAQPPATNV